MAHRSRSPVALGAVFHDGATLMRERAAIYTALAAVCLLVEAFLYRRVDLVANLYAAADGKPFAIVLGPPLGLVLGLSLLAQFAIIPTAVARIEPAFKLTVVGALMMLATIAIVGFVTDIGYVFAIVPGVVVAVLLSQVLVGLLVRLRSGMDARATVGAFVRAIRGSFELTRDHFGTTLGIIILSLAMLVPPFSFVAFWVIVLGAKFPPSLVVTTPALFLLFVYLECSRYALIVRWYRHLCGDARRPIEEPRSQEA